MKKILLLCLGTLFIMSSCVSKKEYSSLENRHKKTQDLLNTATIKLNACLEEKSSAETLAISYKERADYLRRTNEQLFIQSKDYLELSAFHLHSRDNRRRPPEQRSSRHKLYRR